MSRPIEEILAPRPEARPRIYARFIADDEQKVLNVWETAFVNNTPRLQEVRDE